MPTIVRKNLSLILLIFMLSVLVLSVPLTSTVEAQSTYELLTPLPGRGGNLETEVTFSSYILIVFNLAIIIAAVSSVLLIVIGGFQYMSTDSIHDKRDGLDRIKNALIGLILVIASSVILNSIDPGLLKFNLNITPADTSSTSNIIAMTEEEASMRDYLRDTLGIETNNGPCSSGQTQGCTNVAGLPANMIQGLSQLKSGCNNCELVITGGTEGGHATHGVDEAVVDLRPTSSLNTYLNVSNPVNGQTTNSDGMQFIYEDGNTSGTGPHWHVTSN